MKRKRVWEWLERKTGGTARLRIVVILASVIALDVADKGAVSAVAGSLEKSFDIGNVELGSLISIVSLAGAVGTLPAGVLVDRMRRQRILYIAVGLWTVAMVVSGMATSYTYMLISRIFLGVLTAVSLPAVASLVGDFFPPGERGNIYGQILTGELVGFGIGFIFAGEISSWFSWRWAFFGLAVPSGLLTFVLWRYLPEPARTGESRLLRGQKRIHSKEDIERGDRPEPSPERSLESTSSSELAQRKVREKNIQPNRRLVLREDPAKRSLWWAVRYVLHIRTNVMLIIASTLAYMFVAGVRAFGMIFVTSHYNIARSTASLLLLFIGIGGLAGVLTGGRVADWWLRRGRLDARVIVAGIGPAVAVAFLAPAILVSTVWLAVMLFTIGAVWLASANPPLDAARLDIMHPRLWGRAESIRTALRMTFEAFAPVFYGFLSETIFGGGNTGLKWTFIVMLIPLLIASSLAIRARYSYPGDVATVAESLRQQQKSQEQK